eukprot:8397583-Alexandrium_andersonii.AAC.1
MGWSVRGPSAYFKLTTVISQRDMNVDPRFRTLQSDMHIAPPALLIGASSPCKRAGTQYSGEPCTRSRPGCSASQSSPRTRSQKDLSAPASQPMTSSTGKAEQSHPKNSWGKRMAWSSKQTP